MSEQTLSDERVDRLYELPLDEFTSARNALVKELRKDGKREAAEAVKGLKKPSAEAWAVNQLARAQRGEVERLIELGEQQHDVLVSGDRSRVRKAMDDVKGTLSSLSDHAEHLLRGSERKPTPALLERITRMLQTAASSEAGRAALREARLTGELERGDLPEIDVPAVMNRSGKVDAEEGQAESEGRTETKAERDEAKARREAEAQRTGLERGLRRAEERARLLRDRAEELERRAAEARNAAVAAEGAAADAREALVALEGG